MNGVQFACIWGNPAAPEVALVKEMWRTYGAITDEEVIARRAKQIAFVIKDANGVVGGVSTARPVRATFLNNHYFYEFRCFIAPPFRAPGLDSVLARKTSDFLEAQSDSITKFKGMLMIVENEALRKQRTKAVWPATGMTFIGYTPQGYPMRVAYFKGARI